MFPIRSTGGVAPPSRGSRAAGARAAFHLPTDVAATEVTATPETAALDGLLAVQEQSGAADGHASVGDRAARRHGEAVLRELASLQRALLGGHGAGEATSALHRLAALAAATPLADDLAMRGALAAVALRARVALAQHARRSSAELSLVAVPPHGYSPPD